MIAEAIDREAIDSLGIGSEQFLDACGISKGARFRKVEVFPLSSQQLRDLWLLMIHSKRYV